MDRNFLLAIALSLLVLVIWSSYESGRRPKRAPGAGGTPQVEQPVAEPPPPGAAPPAEVAEPAAAPLVRELAEERIAVVETDLFRAELTSHGAALRRWELARYVDKSLPGHPRVVLTTVDRGEAGELATPFDELGYGDLRVAAYELEVAEPLRVVFVRDMGDVSVRKTYTFEQGSYAFRLRVEIENRSARLLRPSLAIHWRARQRALPDFVDQSLVAYHDGEIERARLDRLGKGGFLGARSEPLAPKVFPGEVEWAGAELRYFLTIVAPELPRDADAVFQPIEPSRTGDTILRYSPIELPPGSELVREFRGYLGPKEPELLEAFGSGAAHAIGQGWQWVAPLAHFFAWMLRLCHAVIPNYGVAIIVLTVLVRLVTAPLTARQMRSMRRMGELQPRLRELQEKYRDDRQRQSQEMMKLYRETGVNPLGGCLPLVLQFPVFIGLYYALQSSIDLRQAPFVLWIDDLSRPETLFTIPRLAIPVRVLPLLMGASMILQQKMTPTTMDPQQARMMMTVMPVMFTVLFYQFPSGLVLYWMVSNLLAIGHQMLVNRQKAPA